MERVQRFLPGPVAAHTDRCLQSCSWRYSRWKWRTRSEQRGGLPEQAAPEGAPEIKKVKDVTLEEFTVHNKNSKSNATFGTTEIQSTQAHLQCT